MPVEFLKQSDGINNRVQVFSSRKLAYGNAPGNLNRGLEKSRVALKYVPNLKAIDLPLQLREPVGSTQVGNAFGTRIVDRLQEVDCPQRGLDGMGVAETR